MKMELKAELGYGLVMYAGHKSPYNCLIAGTDQYREANKAGVI